MSFRHYRDISKKPINENDYLKIHNKQLSQKILGFPRDGLVLITGARGSGKTSLLGQMKLDLIDHGYKGLEFSLELKNEKTRQWTVLQACGKDNLKSDTTSNGKKFYSPKSEFIENQIIDWIGDKLEIDDNESFNAKKIEKQIVDRLEAANDIDFCILDNLMRMDIAGYGNEKLLAQIKFIKMLTDMCQKKNICLILVVHPAKTRGIVRFDDISGASEIENLASTAFIVHKIDTDFRARQKQVFNFLDSNPLMQYDTLLEIAKDRDFGQADTLIGLYFEEESKRFLENKGDNICYGWDNRGEQQSFGKFKQSFGKFKQSFSDLRPIDEDDGQLPF